MRKVLRLDYLSTIRLFVMVYSVIGLYTASKSVIVGDESIYCPFGFQYPMLYLTLDVTFKLPQAAWIAPFLVLISVIFYALTGIISGFTAVLLYNLTARFWAGISAAVANESPAAPPAQEISAV
jgi:hypothetical protein